MRPPRKKGTSPGAWAIRIAGLLVIFAVGVALGQSLDDSSPPAGTNTSVGTMAPVVPSADTVTVTVTTTP
jgi:hypothetical protein